MQLSKLAEAMVKIDSLAMAFNQKISRREFGKKIWRP